MTLKKIDEYEGWEIMHSATGSFSIRKAGQTFGPHASIEEAKRAIDLEEGKQTPEGEMSPWGTGERSDSTSRA